MKVLLVNKFHYLKGGSETYYFALGKMLEDAGHQVIYFSMQDEKNISCRQERYFVSNVDFNAEMNPIDIVKASFRVLYSFEAKQKFKQLIVDEKPDIVHLNIFQSQLSGSIVDVAVKYGIPIVYTAHDLKTVCPSYLMMNHGKICDACINGNYWKCIATSCMKDSKAKSILAVMEAEVYRIKKTYSKIDMIICPSKHHQKKLLQANITKNPIVYIPNFLPEGTEYIEGSVQGDYFLFFGRLSVEKGIMTLIKAYEKANIQKPLYIVGSGPQESLIKEYLSKHRLESKIILKGFMTGAILKKTVEKAHCVCLPSECCENAPYSIMEAQACGRPVIVANNGGLPELVEDGITGYIFEAGDIKELAKKIRKADHKTFNTKYIKSKAEERYSHNNYLRCLLNIYNQIIK